MEMKKKATTMVKLALLVFLLGFTASVDAARFDPTSFIAQVIPNGGDAIRSTACCNNCICTKSIPPQCQCVDLGETCHSACEKCFCTRSYPPICRCADITDFCYDPCNKE